MMVECSLCGPRDIKLFYKNKSGKSGVRSKCKRCMKYEKDKKAKEEMAIIMKVLQEGL